MIVDINDIKTDKKVGAKIFNSVPTKLQPCWASLILKEFDSYNHSIPNVVTELYAIIDSENDWNNAHNQFNKIRLYYLNYKDYKPESYLRLAELVAKVTYNSVVGQTAPFDSDSGYYIPSLAIMTAEYYNSKQLLDEVTNHFWLLERFRKFKKEISNCNDLKLFSRIDKILWQHWDPIGLIENGCRDEYYDYLPEMFTLAKNDSTVQELTDKLYYIATETIGVEDTIDRNKEIAEEIKNETQKWRINASS